MALVSEVSVITLESDTDDDLVPMIRVPRNNLPRIVLQEDQGNDEDEDEDKQDQDEPYDHEVEQAARLRRLRSVKRRRYPADVEALPVETISKSIIGNALHGQNIPPQHGSTNPIRTNIHPRARSRSMSTPEYNRSRDGPDANPGPLSGRTVTGTRDDLARKQYNHQTRRFIDDYEDDLELFDNYFGGQLDPLTRWPSPLQHIDMASLDDPVDLTNEPPPESFDKILTTILEVLPDVCPDHVQEKYDQYRKNLTPLDAGILLTDILVNNNYPKRKVVPKRRREEDVEAEALKDVVSAYQIPAASKALQNQFPRMRANYIITILRAKRSVYETILTLTKIEKNPAMSQHQDYEPLRKRRRGSTDIDNISDPNLKAQFQAAQRKIFKDEEAEMLRKKKAEEEEMAAKRAFELKDVSDCQCCFDTYPNAKMVVCNDDTPHTFCFECLEGYIKAQLELQKHDIRCMDTSGCKADFSYSSKKKALDAITFERLERIQQQNELRDADLPLSHCPFCEFAAICPPVEEDRELRCQRDDCQIISCRLCKQKSHLPLSCEEYKKEQGVDERHQIEEMMTKAFLRMCTKCEIPIIKDGGCNKITCSRCHSHICDVCGKDITKEGYKHFGRQCPQSDDLSNGHRASLRVKEAEKIAREHVLAENPDLSEKDLEIKLSEAVKQAENAINRPAAQNAQVAAMVAARNHHNAHFAVIQQAAIRARVAVEQAHLANIHPPAPAPADPWGQPAAGNDYPGLQPPNVGYGAALPRVQQLDRMAQPGYLYQQTPMVAQYNFYDHPGYGTPDPWISYPGQMGGYMGAQPLGLPQQPPYPFRAPDQNVEHWNAMTAAENAARYAMGQQIGLMQQNQEALMGQQQRIIEQNQHTMRVRQGRNH